jgi:hypothetical protein
MCKFDLYKSHFIMELIKELSFNRLRGLKFPFKRYLYDKIDWSNRFIGLLGARGVWNNKKGN